ncbi:cathelicidin-2-like [Eschrichtius robustus]|uniref:cathelicidin-2-like n=1 Tax=Eschrichtius robustus TaxID=9764 RepID=UPI0035C1CD98
METQRASLALGRWPLWLLLLRLVVPLASSQALSYREAVLRAVDRLNERSSEANLYRLLELDPPPKADEDPDTPKPVSFTVKETVCSRTTQQPLEQCDFKENGLVKQCVGTVTLDQSKDQFDINCNELQSVRRFRSTFFPRRVSLQRLPPPIFPPGRFPPPIFPPGRFPPPICPPGRFPPPICPPGRLVSDPQHWTGSHGGSNQKRLPEAVGAKRRRCHFWLEVREAFPRKGSASRGIRRRDGEEQGPQRCLSGCGGWGSLTPEACRAGAEGSREHQDPDPDAPASRQRGKWPQQCLA